MDPILFGPFCLDLDQRRVFRDEAANEVFFWLAYRHYDLAIIRGKEGLNLRSCPRLERSSQRAGFGIFGKDRPSRP